MVVEPVAVANHPIREISVPTVMRHKHFHQRYTRRDSARNQISPNEIKTRDSLRLCKTVTYLVVLSPHGYHEVTLGFNSLQIALTSFSK